MSKLSKYLKFSNYINKLREYINYFLNISAIPIIWYLKKIGFTHRSLYIHGDKKRLHIGKNCSLGNAIFNTRGGDIVIEDYVITGHNNLFVTGIHDYKGALDNLDKIYDVKTSGENIHIEKCVLFGSGAIVLGNVRIGEHSVIGAGSVVTKDIPPYSLAVGIPAKVIKNIKEENICKIDL